MRACGGIRPRSVCRAWSGWHSATTPFTACTSISVCGASRCWSGRTRWLVPAPAKNRQMPATPVVRHQNSDALAGRPGLSGGVLDGRCEGSGFTGFSYTFGAVPRVVFVRDAQPNSLTQCADFAGFGERVPVTEHGFRNGGGIRSQGECISETGQCFVASALAYNFS